MLRTGTLAALGFSLLLTSPLSARQATGEEDPSVLNLLPVDSRALAAATVAEGSLSRTDYLLGDDRRAQAWRLSVPEPGLWRVDLRSDDFDPLLVVVGPGLGQGVTDDDAGGDLDASLCAELDAGEYRVVATSLFGELGEFTLSASPVADEFACEGGIRRPVRNVDPAVMEPSGRVTATPFRADATLSGEEWVDDSPAAVWSFVPEASGSFWVEVRSDDFDPVLRVLGPGIDDFEADDDDSGCGNDARLEVAVEAGVDYRILLSSFFETTGAYEIEVTEDEADLEECADGDFGNFSFGIDFADIEEVQPAGEIGLGESVEGRLDGFSAWVDESSADVWVLPGRAGQSIAVTVSADFDPRVSLLGQELDRTYSDDDGGEGLDSRLCTVLPADGEYRIVVRGFESEPEGAYLLGVEADPPAGSCMLQLREDQEEEMRETFVAAVTSVSGPRVTEGEVVESTLDGSETLIDPIRDRSFDPWVVTLRAGASIDLELRSEFDSWLEVYGPDGREWSDDDGGCGVDARLRVEADLAGDYVILVGSTFETEGTEPYSLRVGGAGGSCVDGALAADAAGTLRVGENVESRLSAGMPLTDRDAEFEAWDLVIEQAGPVVVDLRADFDTYLYVIAPGGEEVRNDDGACGLDSRIVLDAEPGVYRILASSLGGMWEYEGGGAYRLSVSDRERSCAATPRPSGGRPAAAG